jgi:hypothetical protein
MTDGAHKSALSGLDLVRLLPKIEMAYRSFVRHDDKIVTGLVSRGVMVALNKHEFREAWGDWLD